MGAHRLITVSKRYPDLVAAELETVWCDDATPNCETCADFGEWVSEDGDSEPCPDCDGETPAYDPKRDGPHD